MYTLKSFMMIEIKKRYLILIEIKEIFNGIVYIKFCQLSSIKYLAAYV